MQAIQKAVDIAGGQAALAASIGLRQQHVWNWLHRGDRIPAEHCAAIEKLTNGQVTRAQLRPADWERIWPELAEVRGAQEGNQGE